MYAVIKAGGKQQKVKAGDVIEVELVHGGHDEELTFTPLLVVDDEGNAHVGKDLGKAQVKARLVGEKKGEKVNIRKYRPKTGYSRRQGHRQMYTLVEIQDVTLGRRAPAKKKEEPEEPAAPPDEREPAEASEEQQAVAAEPEEALPIEGDDAVETAGDEETTVTDEEATTAEDEEATTAEDEPSAEPTDDEVRPTG